MYIPKHFAMTDFNKAIDFIKTYNFGILVSQFDNKPVATHLPFLLEKRADKWFLVTHIAKANPQKMRIFRLVCIAKNKMCLHGIMYLCIVMENRN